MIPPAFNLPYHPVNDPNLILHGYPYTPNPKIYPGPRPSILCTRTGGYTSGGPSESNSALTDLCASGYFCLFVDCRLAKKGRTGGLPGQTSTGYYPQQTDDLAMGMSYIRSHPLCNGKVALMGGSGSGGHAGWLATTGIPGDTQPDCAVILSGELDASDRQPDVTSTDISKFVLYFQLADTPDNLPSFFERSPVSQVSATTVPIYFANGNPENFGMPWSIAQNFKTALDAVPLSNYIFHENTSAQHSFGTYPENAAAIKEFLAQTLGG